MIQFWKEKIFVKENITGFYLPAVFFLKRSDQKKDRIERQFHIFHQPKNSFVQLFEESSAG